MSNGFFDDHPMLGSMFDFDHDGCMDPGEAGAMAAFGSMVAAGFMHEDEEDEDEDSDCGWGYDASSRNRDDWAW